MASDNRAGIDLASVPTSDVRDHIIDYIGKSDAGRVDMDRVTEAVIGFLKLSGETERKAALDALNAFFCTHCGSGYLPCYCTRDD